MDNRLKRRSDFELVFKKGKRCYARSLLLVYIKARDCKVGYSVSKKNGKAVVRNKIKRQLRAVIRPYLSRIKNCYIVLVPKVAEEYDFHKFEKDVKFLLEREQLLND